MYGIKNEAYFQFKNLTLYGDGRILSPNTTYNKVIKHSKETLIKICQSVY